MTKRTRQIFVLILCLGSAVCLPLILLYGSGFRINWTNFSLQRTGSILVEVFPKNSTLTIFETGLQVKNPALINRLPPQRYSVKITKPGYTTWLGTANVKQNYTVNLSKVVLFLNQPSATNLPNYPNSALLSEPVDRTSLPMTLPSNVVGVQWDTKATTLLHYTPYEIKLYYVDHDQSRIVLRQSTAITEAYWHPLETTIVYVAGGKIQVIETRQTDQPNIFTLYTGTTPTDLRFNSAGDILYFTDEKKIWKLPIM